MLQLCPTLFVTPRTLAHQAPLSMGFSRQEYWSRLPFSPPGDPPNPGIKLESPASPALADRVLTAEPPGKLQLLYMESVTSKPIVYSRRRSTLQPQDWPARLLCPWDSRGRNTGVGCHALLQGIFPTRRLNLCLLRLLHCKRTLHC